VDRDRSTALDQLDPVAVRENERVEATALRKKTGAWVEQRA
jgi:hypothetical protein